MKIEKIDINKIKSNPDNPRLIKDENFKKLAESIKKFPKMLEIRPIVIDDKGMILGGDKRYKACKELKMKTVPVIRASTLSPAEKEEFIVKDNISAGEWDWNKLSGWDSKKLTEWGIEEWMLTEGEKSIVVNEDDYKLPSIDKVKTKIKPGDLFEIGNHRLLCGDSTKKEDVKRLMDGKKAKMIFTDPPYGVDYASKNKFLNKLDKGNRIQTEIIADKTCEGAFDLWGRHFMLYNMILDKIHSVYICSPQTRDLMMMMMMMMMIEKGGIYISNVIIWVKNNHVLGRLDYMLKHEPIIYGWLKSATHKFYGKGDQKFSVWEFDKPFKNDLHPTMKPIELVGNAILNSSLQNDIVYDGFLGSGTTMVACQQLERKCYGMEIEPRYCQVIIDRMKENFPDIVVKKL